MIYFTSDLHFMHENIIRYCDRPFNSVNHMNAQLIRNWNDRIHTTDVVYVLGDVAMDDVEFNQQAKLVQQLNGTKHLILGNHDALKPFTYTKVGFKTVHTALELGPYVLIHDPVASITDHSRIWLCGHVHTLFSECKNCINVGVDVRDYKPISIEEVNEIAKNIGV